MLNSSMRVLSPRPRRFLATETGMNTARSPVIPALGSAVDPEAEVVRERVGSLRFRIARFGRFGDRPLRAIAFAKARRAGRG